jgi:predicted RNA-binding Zn-ribbon protein involved in translation (DUF1610 family)
MNWKKNMKTSADQYEVDCPHCGKLNIIKVSEIPKAPEPVKSEEAA